MPKQFCAMLALAVVAWNHAAATQTGALQSTEPAEENPCLRPAPLFSVDDYNGVEQSSFLFSRKPEIKTVHRSSSAGTSQP
jgi:hypothetical protein